MSTNEIIPSDFIDLVTDPESRNKSEIFKFSAIKKYIEHWSEKDKPQMCTVCQFAIQSCGPKKQLLIKRLLVQTSEFAQTMPENMIGVICTWLFMRYTGQQVLQHEDSFDIDPLSIMFHIIIGCCDAVLGTDTGHYDICGALQSPLFSMARQATKSKEPKGNTSSEHEEELKLLLECLRGYVDTLISKRSKRQFSCEHCLYNNNGKIQTYQDYRVYISDKWVKEKLHIDYDRFIEEEFYEMYVPGIFMNNKTHQITDTNAQEVRGDTIDSQVTYRNAFDGSSQPRIHKKPVGFLAVETAPSCKTGKGTSQYVKEHLSKIGVLSLRLSYFLSIIKTIPGRFQNSKSPVSIISMSFPICKWCVLCLDKRMRLIINDLFVMCGKKAADTGITNEKFAVKIAPTYSSITASDSSDSTNNCTLGFYKSVLPLYVLKPVFDEWSKQKYPFIQSFVNSEDSLEEIANLHVHGDANKSIYCLGNIRRMYIESDLHKQGQACRCFIIYGIQILQTLLNVNVKLSKEKSIIKKAALEHNIPISHMLV